jgi:type IV pilus assembly protein PilB
MSAVIDLPMPPFLTHSHEAVLYDAQVIVRQLDDAVVRGRLQELNSTEGCIVITSDSFAESSRVIPFTKIRYLSFVRPSISLDPQRDVAFDDDLTDSKAFQSFRLVYKGGKALTGKACSVDVDKSGIHIYQSKDHQHIHRVFVPMVVIERYRISPPAGQPESHAANILAGDVHHEDAHLPSGVSLVENIHDLQAVLEQTIHDDRHQKYIVDDDAFNHSERQIQAALEAQKNKKDIRIGSILVELNIISEAQLRFALQLQKKYPHKPLGEFLIRMGAITEAKLQNALGVQKKEKNKKKKQLGEVLEEMGVINDEASQIALARKFDLPFVRLHNFDIDPEVIALVPFKVAVEQNIIPLCLHDEHLVIALSDPLDVEKIDMVRFITGHSVEITIATKADIEHVIDKYYQGHAASEILDELEVINHEEEINQADIRRDEALSKEAPVVRLVDNIITDAIVREASDIHIRPEEHSVELIYRIDGVLTNVRTFSKQLLSAVVSRIKILGGMDIAERRLPQDGRFRVNYRKAIIDLRISIMPTVQGESVVIRILNTQAGLKSINELGFTPHDEFLFTDLLHKSYGVFLVTGPTGCGKSTTLYAALQEIKKTNVNIITIEDPVEYRLSGIQQLQVHSSIGYTFARALRNILRHDPDVIMVGEIRDEETGKIAIESALTGHLVLSTLHTNDASGAITRLMEMGVESYLVRSAVLGVLAQRLVRKNCPHCLVEEKIDEGLRRAIGVDEDEKFYVGQGCEECNHTGYKGRLAVYELLPVNDAIRSVIQEGVGANEIHKIAVESGMVPLTEQALQQARQRKTSFAEVYRVRLE